MPTRLSSLNNWRNSTHQVRLYSNKIISNKVSIFYFSNSLLIISCFPLSFIYCFSNFNIYYFSCLPPLPYSELLQYPVILFLAFKNKRNLVIDYWKNEKKINKLTKKLNNKTQTCDLRHTNKNNMPCKAIILQLETKRKPICQWNSPQSKCSQSINILKLFARHSICLISRDQALWTS